MSRAVNGKPRIFTGNAFDTSAHFLECSKSTVEIFNALLRIEDVIYYQGETWVNAHLPNDRGVDSKSCMALPTLGKGD